MQISQETKVPGPAAERLWRCWRIEWTPLALGLSGIFLISQCAGPAVAQGAPLVLERDGRVISLVPYAPNILRVTMSIGKAAAIGAPGYGIVANSPWGLAGPKGMDPKIVKKLHDAFKKGMEEPAFLKTLDTFYMEPIYKNSEDYAQYARQLSVEAKDIVEKLGLNQK